MKVLIIEDELLAQAKLAAMLKKIEPSVEVLARLGSVTDSVQWLKENSPPDVAFVDIQLSDDHSFEIFRKVPAQFPVIFTTAYDKYLLESFEFNGIDYLLKPITEDKLTRSILKLKNLEQHFLHGNLHKILQDVLTQKSEKRIVLKKGTEFITMNYDEIAYFFTDHRIVFVRNFQGKQFIADRTLSEIESNLDQKQFFRINRKYIANIRAIERFKPDNGKVRIFLNPEVKEEVHVSKETAPEFRKWIGDR